MPLVVDFQCFSARYRVVAYEAEINELLPSFVVDQRAFKDKLLPVVNTYPKD
jgi:hypothetical protein